MKDRWARGELTNPADDQVARGAISAAEALIELDFAGLTTKLEGKP